jgi:uncharacterized membrane protein YdbT with pleckstrin-like domain
MVNKHDLAALQKDKLTFANMCCYFYYYAVLAIIIIIIIIIIILFVAFSCYLYSCIGILMLLWCCVCKQQACGHAAYFYSLRSTLISIKLHDFPWTPEYSKSIKNTDIVTLR